MNFDLDESQAMLRDTLARYLSDEYDFSSRRHDAASTAGHNAKCWSDLADRLGVLGAAFPVAQGGLGGGAIENMVVMEELGAALSLEPYLSTAVIGGGFLKRSASPDRDALLRGIIEGSAIVAFAHSEPHWTSAAGPIATTATREGDAYIITGSKALVRDAPYASHLIVTARAPGGIGIFLVESGAAGIRRDDYATHDGARASAIRFEAVSCPASSLLSDDRHGQALIDEVLDEAVAALCAEAVGILRRLLSDTVRYTRERKQFGRPISEFQALQQRMADMAMHVERAAAMTLLATLKLPLPLTQRSRAVSAAKVTVGRACRFVGQSAVQLHGGIGMTDELAIGHYFKRATMIECELGTTGWHLARYAQLARTDASSSS